MPHFSSDNKGKAPISSGSSSPKKNGSPVRPLDLRKITGENSPPVTPKSRSSRSPSFIVETNPFSLVQFYCSKGNLFEVEQNLDSTTPVIDRNTAQQLLIDALKTGNNHYFDLVSLLLDDSACYEELQNELHTLFVDNQAVLLPLKQHLCILSAMQDILRDVHNLITKTEKPFEDNAIFYTQLVDRLKNAQDDYIRGQFDINVGMYLKDEALKEAAWIYCLHPLRTYLPVDITSAQKSYFSIESIPLQNLLETITLDISKLGQARDVAQDKYETLCKPIAELENSIGVAKRIRRQTLAEALFESKNHEEKAGIPWSYKDHFKTVRSLMTLAGSVPLDAVEKETGSNIALIALQYNNDVIYTKLFSSNKEYTKTSQPNLLGLSAEHYDKALFWKNKEEREIAQANIQLKDANGELLRRIEKEIRQYIHEWHRKNNRLKSLDTCESITGDFLENFAVIFIKLFNDPTLFEKRIDEANHYLNLVQEAMKDIPADFYEGITALLQQSDWGRLKGSQLHNMMARHRDTILTNPAHYTLVNPTQLLLQKVKVLESLIDSNETSFQEELHKQKIEHERAMEQMQRHNEQALEAERIKTNHTFQEILAKLDKLESDKVSSTEEVSAAASAAAAPESDHSSNFFANRSAGKRNSA